MADVADQDAMRIRDLPVAIAAFSAAGLHPTPRSRSSFCDLWIGAGLRQVDPEIQAYDWVCWLRLTDGQWEVTPPPHMAGGPGPLHTVATIGQAISLVLHLAKHRKTVTGTACQQIERAEALYQQWRQAQACDSANPPR